MEPQTGEVSRLSRGQSLDVEAGVSEGFLPAEGPLNRAEGGRHCSGVGSAQDMDSET